MNKTLDIGKWLGRALFEPGYYYDLCSYVEDSEQLSKHIDGIEFSKLTADQPKGVNRSVKEFEKLKKELTHRHYSDSINQATNTFSRQMMVFAASLIEALLCEFFESMFFKNPEKMYKYLKVGQLNGVVEFRTILNSTNKESIIEELVNKASKKALEGSAKQKLKRVENLNGFKLEDSIKTRTEELFEKRNKIIHELNMSLISKEQVTESFNILYDLVVCLGKAAVKNNVPVNDPAHLVTKAPYLD